MTGDELQRLKSANESLTQELLAAYEELELVHGQSSIFATSTDIDEMGERLVAETLEALEAESGFLIYTGQGMEEFEPVLRGAEPEEVQAFVHLAAPKILEGQSVLVDEARADGYEARPLLTVPLRGRDGIFGALGLTRRPGGTPFTAGNLKALTVLANQASSVILQRKNLDLTYLSESLKRTNEGLQALLDISRELSATLDVGRVLAAIVNLPGKVVAFDRASIALREGTRWRLRAVSGEDKVDLAKPDMRDLESLLGWVGERGEKTLSVEKTPAGDVRADDEVRPVLNAHFERAGMSSFYAILLADDEGVLGVYALERRNGLCPSETARELLGVMANQATVGLRNAQLYQQLPLVGLLERFGERRRQIAETSPWRRIAWVAGPVLVLAAMLLVPAPLRISGPVLLVPERSFAVSAAVPGRLASVEVVEGQGVARGEIVARLDDRDFRLELTQAEARAEEAERRARQAEASQDPRAAALERVRLQRQRREAQVAAAELSEIALRAPEAGIVLTPRIQERAGERLEAGEVFCTLAAMDPLVAEVAVPESEIGALQDGMRSGAGFPAVLKLNTFADRTFSGKVIGMRPAVEERDGQTVVIVRVHLDNPDGKLRPGMRGRGRIEAGRVRLATFFLRRPARWVRSWFWM